MVVTPHSPLGIGVLTGKYNQRDRANSEEQGRMQTMGGEIPDRNLAIA